MVTKNRRESIARNVRKLNVLKILDEQGPLPHNQLKKKTNLYPGTFSTILKELGGEDKIEQIPHKGRLAYTITKKGKGTILEFGIIGMLATKMMQEGAKYHDDYSNSKGTMYYYQLPWGIQDDIVMEKSLRKLNPITTKTASEMQKTLYRCIKEDVKKRKITLDSSKDGKIILGFMIDYKDLTESINEQSMDYIDIISKREDDLLSKWEDGKITKQEIEEFEKIRKMTKVKLRRRK